MFFFFAIAAEPLVIFFSIVFSSSLGAWFRELNDDIPSSLRFTSSYMIWGCVAGLSASIAIWVGFVSVAFSRWNDVVSVIPVNAMGSQIAAMAFFVVFTIPIIIGFAVGEPESLFIGTGFTLALFNAFLFFGICSTYLLTQKRD